MPAHTGGNRPQGRAGFARTELVIITATVSLLALLQAATLGALGPATGGAQCLANLRELTRAWQQYGLQEGQLPPNPGDGNTSPGRNWVPGVCGPRQGEEFNPEVLQDPGRSLLFPYLEPGDSAVFRCPADGRMGRYQGTDPALAGRMVPAARSYAMNAAVGTTTLNGIVFAPLDGPWLDNHHTHRRGQKWRTYARFDEIIDPAPANLAVLLGEDANSINDGSLVFGMETPEWIDWVSTRHSMSGGIAFADGHVGMHAWTDPRTVVRNGIVNRVRVPGSVDHAWLRDRISARIELDRPRILPPAPALGLNRMRLVWPAAGAPGHRLESTTDLRTWQPAEAELKTDAAQIIAALPDAMTDGQRFYRLAPE